MNLQNSSTDELKNMIKALSSSISQWLNTPEDEKRLVEAKKILKLRKVKI